MTFSLLMVALAAAVVSVEAQSSLEYLHLNTTNSTEKCVVLNLDSNPQNGQSFMYYYGATIDNVKCIIYKAPSPYYTVQVTFHTTNTYCYYGNFETWGAHKDVEIYDGLNLTQSNRLRHAYCASDYSLVFGSSGQYLVIRDPMDQYIAKMSAMFTIKKACKTVIADSTERTLPSPLHLAQKPEFQNETVLDVCYIISVDRSRQPGFVVNFTLGTGVGTDIFVYDGPTITELTPQFSIQWWGATDGVVSQQTGLPFTSSGDSIYVRMYHKDITKVKDINFRFMSVQGDNYTDTYTTTTMYPTWHEDVTNSIRDNNPRSNYPVPYPEQYPSLTSIPADWEESDKFWNRHPEIWYNAAQDGAMCAVYDVDPDPTSHRVWKYDNNINCFIFRAAAPDYFVEATIRTYESFDDGSSRSCDLPDDIQVFDGNSTLNQQIWDVRCGDSSAEVTVTSSGQYLTVIATYGGRQLDNWGFTSTKRCTPLYADNIGRNLPDPKFHVGAPGYDIYPWYLECYTLIADPDKKMEIWVDDGLPYFLYIQNGLKEDDGHGTRLAMVGKNQGGYYSGPMVTKGSAAYVLIYYPNVHSISSFTLRYYAVDKDEFSALLIALIVLSVLVVLLFMVLMITVCCKKCKGRNATYSNASPTNPAQQSASQPVVQPGMQPGVQPGVQPQMAVPGYYTVIQGQGGQPYIVNNAMATQPPAYVPPQCTATSAETGTIPTGLAADREKTKA